MSNATRNKEISKRIKQEIADFVVSLENMGRNTVTSSPLCGRVCDRTFNMKRHILTHTRGKLVGSSAPDLHQTQHPVFMSIIRALYDHDALSDVEGEKYGRRALELLRGWLKVSPRACDTGSVWTAMGKRDNEVVFVLTGTGPEYWKNNDNRLRNAKLFQSKQYYTMEFANVFTRFLLQNGGCHARAMRATRLSFEAAGCEVTALMNRNTQAMATMACDIMTSKALKQLRDTNLETLGKQKEFRSVSIDATYKLSLKVTTQSGKHGHNWVSVVGFRGSPIALHESKGEGVQVLTSVLKQAVPDAYKDQVENVSSDVCGGKLYTSLQGIFPKLTHLTLDPMHLCFRVDSCTKKSGVKPTVVGLVLRSIMGKFSMVKKKCSESPHVGQAPARLSQEEQKAVDLIKTGGMDMKTAKDTLTSMGPNNPIGVTQGVRVAAGSGGQSLPRADGCQNRQDYTEGSIGQCSDSRPVRVVHEQRQVQVLAAQGVGGVPWSRHHAERAAARQAEFVVPEHGANLQAVHGGRGGHLAHR